MNIRRIISILIAILIVFNTVLCNANYNNESMVYNNNIVNRLMLCKMCVNTYRECTGENFTVWDADSVIVDIDDDDVRLAWFVGLMRGTDIIDFGDDGLKYYFSPEKIVDREQASTVFYRLIRLLDKEISKSEPYIKTGFCDDYYISDWAKDSVESLRVMGKLIGDENNCFNPSQNITKEELEIVLERIKTQYTGTNNYRTKLYNWY